MVKVAVARWHVSKGKEAGFERFIKSNIRKSKSAKGALGGLFLKSEADPSTYMGVAFWHSKAERETFLKNAKISEKAKEYTSVIPETEWFDTVARLQKTRIRPRR